MRYSRSFAAPLAACLLALGMAAPASAQQQGGATDEVVETHGAWDIRCTPEREVCVMHQVGQGPGGNDVLEVRIRKLDGVTTESGQPIPAAIQIATPLGVLLQQGVRLKIDGGETRGLPFQICVQGGCLVRSALPSPVVEAMKAGRVATMTVSSPQQGEIPVEISLSGFIRSFSELNP